MAAQQLLFDVPITGTKISRRKAPTVPRIKVDHKLAKARYYCHRRLKDVFPIDSAKRIVDAEPYQSLDEIPARHRRNIIKLIDLGYNVQLSIPCQTPPQITPKKKRSKTKRGQIIQNG